MRLITYDTNDIKKLIITHTKKCIIDSRIIPSKIPFDILHAYQFAVLHTTNSPYFS